MSHAARAVGLLIRRAVRPVIPAQAGIKSAFALNVTFTAVTDGKAVYERISERAAFGRESSLISRRGK